MASMTAQMLRLLRGRHEPICGVADETSRNGMVTCYTCLHHKTKTSSKFDSPPYELQPCSGYEFAGRALLEEGCCLLAQLVS